METNTRYKEGDKVRLISTLMQKEEFHNWIEKDHMVIGDYYTVKAYNVNSSYQGGSIMVEGGKFEHPSSKFELGEDKADAYIGGHPISLYFYNDKFKNIDKGESVRGAYKYNIMSEVDFKAKYPDKLKFKGHNVDVSTTRIKVGCQTYDKEEIETFFEIATDMNDNNVKFDEAYDFIRYNYKELGL